MRTKGCEWKQATYDFAAMHAGRHQVLEVLQGGRAKGCEWGSDACNIAAIGGHLHGGAEVGQSKRMSVGRIDL